LGFFPLFRNSDRLAGTFRGVRRSQYSLARTFHHRRSRLLKTGFFRQVGKGAENTKGKFLAVLYALYIDGLDMVGMVNMAYNHPLCDWKC
jgi:hypothetical protein